VVEWLRLPGWSGSDSLARVAQTQTQTQTQWWVEEWLRLSLFLQRESSNSYRVMDYILSSIFYWLRPLSLLQGEVGLKSFSNTYRVATVLSIGSLLTFTGWVEYSQRVVELR
jgi:hypothetical protein